MKSELVEKCAVGGKCEGICPDSRNKPKSSCPAFYLGETKPVLKRRKLNEKSKRGKSYKVEDEEEKW